MPVQTYETLLLLDPTKVSADADGVKQQVHHILERHGAEVLISRPWDYNHKL
jgi:ribosomal protein S6